MLVMATMITMMIILALLTVILSGVVMQLVKAAAMLTKRGNEWMDYSLSMHLPPV